MLDLSLCESLCVRMDQNRAMSVSPQEFENANETTRSVKISPPHTHNN